jgi:3-methyladenine DNA glycosylase AlkD
MTQPYVKDLERFLRPYANAANAKPMRAYMKDQFSFLGIKSPERKTLLAEFISRHGLPKPENLEGLARDLWKLPEREFQYYAIDLLERSGKHLKPDNLPLIEDLICQKSWWDTVDAIASHLVGKTLLSYPEARVGWIGKWRKAENLWLRRSTLLFQLSYKDKTDQRLLFDLIKDNLGSTEFFINKAIGWALREYSKTNADAVRRFVKATNLAPLSKHEALKWLERSR